MHGQCVAIHSTGRHLIPFFFLPQVWMKSSKLEWQLGNISGAKELLEKGVREYSDFSKVRNTRKKNRGNWKTKNKNPKQSFSILSVSNKWNSFCQGVMLHCLLCHNVMLRWCFCYLSKKERDVAGNVKKMFILLQQILSVTGNTELVKSLSRRMSSKYKA